MNKAFSASLALVFVQLLSTAASHADGSFGEDWTIADDFAANSSRGVTKYKNYHAANFNFDTAIKSSAGYSVSMIQTTTDPLVRPPQQWTITCQFRPKDDRGIEGGRQGESRWVDLKYRKMSKRHLYFDCKM